MAKAKEKEPAPTMLYAPNGDNGGTESNGYWYKVVDRTEVKACLADGWYKKPGDLPETDVKRD